MADNDPLTGLLGPDRPVRVIPAAPAGDHLADHTHHVLGELPGQRVTDHPQGHPELEFHHLAEYPHDPCGHQHQVLVSASHEHLLTHHLATTEVCICADPEGHLPPPPDASQQVHLLNLIEEAVASVTGATLKEHLQATGGAQPPDLYALLGSSGDEVMHVAAHALARRLEELAAAGVIDGGLLGEFDPHDLIDQLLAERRDQGSGEPDDGVIVTTLIHPSGDHPVRFSMQITGPES